MKILCHVNRIAKAEILLMPEVVFPIVERFFTLSGEAPTAGQPMYLIRFSGCNLNCSYCDTPNRNEINEQLTFTELADVIAKVEKEYPGAFVLFTGGEPLLNERMEAISQLAAKHSDVLFYVETNGSVFIQDFGKGNLRYVADWKTFSSGEGGSFCKNNIKKLRAGLDCIKIVVDKNDLVYVRLIIDAIKKDNPGLDIYLSPQTGKIDLKDLAAFIIENRLDVRLSLQLHKIIWGFDAKGV